MQMRNKFFKYLIKNKTITKYKNKSLYTNYYEFHVYIVTKNINVSIINKIYDMNILIPKKYDKI